ncbi:MAG: response regulator [Bradyrhizobium sp.]|nr:response regulator [Bradyrhizobium sp.]
MRAERAPRPTKRLLDELCIAAILLGTSGLFIADILEPRGVLDGIGYPAIVAISARFGRRAVTICSTLVGILIIVAAFVVPDAGVSVAGELANRFFALLSVGIVALVLNQRFGLEHFIATRETTMARHQQALLEAVHQVLLTNLPFQSRVRNLTEIAAESLEVGRVSIFRWREGSSGLECLDVYHPLENRHEIIPDVVENRHPEYLEAMRRELVVVSDDVQNTSFLAIRRDIFAENRVGAVIGAGIFLDGKLVGQIVFSHLDKPRAWTMEEIAYARALANMMSILFSADRNSETLAALDLVSEGIYATAETGSILYANRAARKTAAAAMLPTSERGVPAWAYPHPVTPLEGASDEQIVTVGSSTLEIYRARLPRGGIITRINDVTARKAAARESEQLHRKLEQAAKMEAIGELAGGIAHDFNNILSAIMGFARFLEEDLPANTEQHGFAARILASCERGKRLVDQILDFALAKVAEGDVVDLGHIIHQCEDHLLPTLPQMVTLDVKAEEGFAFVTGSSVKLFQIIANLCSNACDAIASKGGTVRLELARADRSELEEIAAGAGETWIGEVDGDKNYARVRVIDEGEGIAGFNLSRIFEPFFTTKGRHRGTGLGLAVVHGAVLAHKGVCHVRSELGVGTTMSIYLPLVDFARAHEIREKDDAMLGNERVLLVDDESDIVETMSRGLSRMGYFALGTGDPNMVVRAVEDDANPWDVVITDQMMPALTGLELIKKIKSLRPDLLTILCTGYGDAADEESALSAGADAYIRKPVDAAGLAQCIRRLRAEKRIL